MISTTTISTTARKRILILGGGFGGLHAAQSLKHAPLHVTLVDKRNFHLFQPLLYQVATGWLSPANIASTLRAVLKRQGNVRVILAEAIDIDVDKRQVILGDGILPYDTLIVATGSRHHYFGNDHWEPLAPGLKTIEDATEMRRRIFLAFETAERESNLKLPGVLNFIIVGGGPTGVELAGALGEIAKDTLRSDFRNIDPADARILLLEATNRILQSYPPELATKAERFLGRLGVTIQTNTTVTDIQPDAVIIKRGEDAIERIPCRTVLWAAGVQSSFLGKVLAKATGAQLDRSGRVLVEGDLTLPNHPEIFVIGDLANYPHQTGQPLPGTAPVAMQQGRYVAALLRARIEAKSIPPFHYKDRGNMAIVGRGLAVATLGKFRLSGFLAWLTWLFVHLINLVQFENKVLVLVQWGWYYINYNRAARLITGEKTVP